MEIHIDLLIEENAFHQIGCGRVSFEKECDTAKMAVDGDDT